MRFALALGLAVALPLLLHGTPSCGHDFDFHLQSWLAVRDAWAHGIANPHWIPAANYGAGEPRFVFYPPLSWLLGALLGAVLPWAWAPLAFTAVCAAGAGAAMFQTASRFCAPAEAGLAASAYAASPYLLFTAYERTAYGELLAAVWMPLLLGALLLPRLPVARVGVLLAALWYTNAPAGVMGCYLVILAVCWKLFAHRRVGEAVRHGAALALGGLLAADYLLPAWYEQRFIAIERAVGEGMRVRDSFLFGRAGSVSYDQVFHDQVLHTASWIAVGTLAVGAVAGVGALWRGRGTTSQRQAAGFCVLLIGVCFLLQLRLSGPVWDALPELGFLQFPWRLLLPGSVAAALLLALSAGAWRRLLVAGAACLFVGGMVFWAGVTRYQPCDEEDNVPAQRALVSAGGFAGTDEYAAKGSDNGEIQQGLPPVRLLRSPGADEGDDSASPNPAWKPETAARGVVQVRRWGAEHIEVRVHPEAQSYAVLRLERFPAWRIRLNGEPCGARCVGRDDGLITVALPPARWSAIDAAWHTTADVWWGRALSGCGLLLLPLLGRQAMMRRK